MQLLLEAWSCLTEPQFLMTPFSLLNVVHKLSPVFLSSQSCLFSLKLMFGLEGFCKNVHFTSECWWVRSVLCWWCVVWTPHAVRPSLLYLRFFIVVCVISDFENRLTIFLILPLWTWNWVKFLGPPRKALGWCVSVSISCNPRTQRLKTM